MLMIFGFFFSALTAEAQFTIHPSITVGEEYNDNVFDSYVNKKSDFITHIMPGLNTKYKTAFWDLDLSYLYDYRYYAKNSRNDDSAHDLSANGLITIVDNLLFLEVNEAYRKVSLDVTRDYTRESLNFDQTDSNIVTASPYVKLRPFTQLETKIGYRYGNFWYDDPEAISKSQHSGYITMDYEVMPKIFINSSYTYTISEARQNPHANSYTKHNAYIGPRYEYADKCFIFGYGGYTDIEFRDGTSFSNPFWNAGINHTFGTYVALIEAMVRYDEDPLQVLTEEMLFSGKLEKKLPRGSASLGVRYSEYTDLKTDKLTQKTYGGELGFSYELLPRLTAKLDFVAERYDYEDNGGHTNRIFVNPLLRYELPREISVSLEYMFVDYDSPTIVEDNRRTNRAMVELTKVF